MCRTRSSFRICWMTAGSFGSICPIRCRSSSTPGRARRCPDRPLLIRQTAQCLTDFIQRRDPGLQDQITVSFDGPHRLQPLPRRSPALQQRSREPDDFLLADRKPAAGFLDAGSIPANPARKPLLIVLTQLGLVQYPAETRHAHAFALLRQNRFPQVRGSFRAGGPAPIRAGMLASETCPIARSRPLGRDSLLSIFCLLLYACQYPIPTSNFPRTACGFRAVAPSRICFVLS